LNVNLGLKHNWKQFTLLVIINGFVGGMVGLGYAFGALATGIIADAINIEWSVGFIADLALISALIIWWRMD
jgi:hypothetical protein